MVMMVVVVMISGSERRARRRRTRGHRVGDTTHTGGRGRQGRSRSSVLFLRLELGPREPEAFVHVCSVVAGCAAMMMPPWRCRRCRWACTLWRDVVFNAAGADTIITTTNSSGGGGGGGGGCCDSSSSRSSRVCATTVLHIGIQRCAFVTVAKARARRIAWWTGGTDVFHIT